VPKVSEAHLEARREQIMQAALACFAREGFHRATTQDIVDEAGLSFGALYRYFESKDEIIEAVTSERHERERALLKQAAEAGFRDALRMLASGFFGSLRGRTARIDRRVRVQIYAEALRNPRIHRLVRRGIDEPREVLAGVVRDAQADGLLPSEFDPDALARVIIATFHGLVLQQTWDERVDVEAYVRTLGLILGRLEARR
jgi:AcrR family transcriptional regulator